MGKVPFWQRSSHGQKSLEVLCNAALKLDRASSSTPVAISKQAQEQHNEPFSTLKPSAFARRMAALSRFCLKFIVYATSVTLLVACLPHSGHLHYLHKGFVKLLFFAK